MPPCRKILSTKAVHGVKLVAENAFWPKKYANLDQDYSRRDKVYFVDQFTERIKARKDIKRTCVY